MSDPLVASVWVERLAERLHIDLQRRPRVFLGLRLAALDKAVRESQRWVRDVPWGRLLAEEPGRSVFFEGLTPGRGG
jgi:hypothetical protein